MNKYNLLSKSRRRRKWVQNNESIHRYTNLLERNFHASRPNLKWCTDISYIPTKEGFVYLSVIKDLYDNFVVAYKVGTENSNSLVCETIKAANREVTAELQLHSDQGFQYTSEGYFKLTYNYERIQLKTKLTPYEKRCQFQEITSF